MAEITGDRGTIALARGPVANRKGL